jgi:Uma2 family endonuclease
MSANTLLPPAMPYTPPNPLPFPSGEQRLVLTDISWQNYVELGKIFDERHIRLTFDRGNLEIMTLSREHERINQLLSQLVAFLLVETRTVFENGGAMTFQREDLERGLEPDNCYWIQHYAQVRGPRILDFHVDPPPDLACEVEVSRNVLNRLAIFAALRVPEVWRCDGQTLRVLLLREDGQYHESARSLALPFFPVADLMRFLALRDPTDTMTILVAFQQWVREQVAANWGQSPSVSQ